MQRVPLIFTRCLHRMGSRFIYTVSEVLAIVRIGNLQAPEDDALIDPHIVIPSINHSQDCDPPSQFTMTRYGRSIILQSFKNRSDNHQRKRKTCHERTWNPKLLRCVGSSSVSVFNFYLKVLLSSIDCQCRKFSIVSIKLVTNYMTLSHISYIYFNASKWFRKKSPLLFKVVHVMSGRLHHDGSTRDKYCKLSNIKYCKAKAPREITFAARKTEFCSHW